MAYPGWSRKRRLVGPAVGMEVPHLVVAAATGTNQTVTSLASGSSLGGVTLANGDHFLLLGQTNAYENGLWTIYGHTTGAYRPDYYRGPHQAIPGMLVTVKSGTYSGCTWELGAMTGYGNDGYGIVPDGTKHFWFPAEGSMPCVATNFAAGATYAVGTWEGRIDVDASGGAVTVNLPDPQALVPSPYSTAGYVGRPGRLISVAKSDSSGNAVTVAAAAGSVLGATSLASQYSSGLYVSNGTNWLTVAKN